VDTLNQRRGTVAHPDYGYIYLTQYKLPSFQTLESR
jgi:hypothetical protein